MTDVELDYEYLMQNALRQVLREVLTITAEIGAAPGEHHFFIEFRTGAEGVILPDHLRAAYPERMTIVLQHQFENLIIDEEAFSITLWFKGKEANLRIPFSAVTSFADPSVEFGLHFNADTDDDDQPVETKAAPKNNADITQNSPTSADDKAGERNADGDEDATSADVVSLDSFRKK